MKAGAAKTTKDLLELAKQVAAKEPKLAGVADRFIVTVTQQSATRKVPIIVDATKSRDARQLAFEMVGELRQAKSVRQMRRVEASAFKEIAAANSRDLK